MENKLGRNILIAAVILIVIYIGYRYIKKKMAEQKEAVADIVGSRPFVDPKEPIVKSENITR